MASWILQDRPFGAYTCARAFDNGHGIVQRDFHVSRMRHSMSRVFGESFNENHERSVVEQVEAILNQPLEPNVMLVIVGYLKDGKAFVESKPFPMSFKRVVLEKIVVGGGSGRINPTAKHSTWIETRKPLEKIKLDRGADEVVLVEEDGDDFLLLEGLTTNIFILMQDGRSLQTAPCDKGLSGSMRELVKHVCEEQGFSVLETCPRWSDRATWRAAFVTNVSKAAFFVRRLELWSDSTKFVELSVEGEDISNITRAVDKALSGA